MATIILSIKPNFAESILNGSKRFEFRKVECRRSIDHIVIYATAPLSKVIGEVDVIETLIDTPDALWLLSEGYAGIDRDSFERYFGNRKSGIAFKLCNPKKFSIGKDLEEYGLTQPPQSFVYFPEGEDE